MARELTRRSVLRYSFTAAVAGTASLALGTGLTACGGDSDSAAKGGSLLDGIKSSGTLKVGIANEKPYSYKGKSGEPQGLVIDIVKALTKPWGVTTIEATVGSFDSLIPGLQAKHYDVIAAGMYILPERCEAVLFSDPVYQVGQGMIVAKGNPLDVHSVADVAKNPKIRICTQTGSNQVKELKDAGVKDAQVTLVQTEAQAMSALTGGRVDAIYFPALQIAALMLTNKNAAVERVEPFEQLHGPDGKPVYGYAALPCRKDDEALVKALNERIHAMRDDGSLLDVLKKYGLTKEEVPSAEATAASLCKKPQ